MNTGRMPFSTLFAIGLSLSFPLAPSMTHAQSAKLTIDATGINARGGQGNESAQILVSVTDEHGEGVSGLKATNFAVAGLGCDERNCALVPFEVRALEGAAGQGDIAGTYLVTVVREASAGHSINLGAHTLHWMFVRISKVRALVGAPPAVEAQGQLLFSFSS